jgi:hypothetical protein
MKMSAWLLQASDFRTDNKPRDLPTTRQSVQAVASRLPPVASTEKWIHCSNPLRSTVSGGINAICFANAV